MTRIGNRFMESRLESWLLLILQGSWIMKEGIHPEYRDVVFQDTSTGAQFVIGSTIKTQKTVEYEGRTLPMVTVDISSASHPFFTGKQKFIDAAGRVEKFQRKYNWGKKDEAAEPTAKG
jgi:large subunit ribosomal protein L31